jgi:hypothetical protein
VFFGRRDEPIEVDRLEVIGTERGAVFAFHRPDVWEVAGIEIRGAIYHAVEVDHGRIKRIADHAERAVALTEAGLQSD